MRTKQAESAAKTAPTPEAQREAAELMAAIDCASPNVGEAIHAMFDRLAVRAGADAKQLVAERDALAAALAEAQSRALAVPDGSGAVADCALQFAAATAAVQILERRLLTAQRALLRARCVDALAEVERLDEAAAVEFGLRREARAKFADALKVFFPGRPLDDVSVHYLVSAETEEAARHYSAAQTLTRKRDKIIMALAAIQRKDWDLAK